MYNTPPENSERGGPDLGRGEIWQHHQWHSQRQEIRIEVDSSNTLC